jgi:hypothetical protein
MTLQYHYFSYLRRGAAAHLAAAPSGLDRATLRAEVEITVDKIAGGTEPVLTRSRDIQLFGPGDVLGFDRSAVLAAEPRDGSGDFEANYLCAIHFHAGDFPWRMSPVVPDGNDNLRPWIVLIALKRDEIKKEIPGGNGAPPAITVDARLLPQLADSWRWAHVQVTHDGPVGAGDWKNLLAKQPHEVTSRLLCGRHLEFDTHYVAMVVPAFATGVAAGLGLDPPAGMTSTSDAWGNSGDVTLPYYFRWEFGTGPAGDFEALVRLLKPPQDPLVIGVRPMDCTRPGFNVGDGSLQLMLEGAIQSVGAPWSRWGHDAPPPVPPAPLKPTKLHEQLAALINQPLADLAATLPAGREPVVAPPIYGRWHAARKKTFLRQADAPAAPLSNAWIDQLNLDPRHRAAAGLGALVAENEQEGFMAAAWRQIGEVERANEVIRRAQLAREASGTLHRRYQVMTSERKAAFLGLAAKRVLAADKAQTLAAKVQAVGAVAAALDPAFRKLTRPRGVLAKRQSAAKRAAAGGLLARLHIGLGPRLVAAGAAPAPKGVVTWSAVGARLAPTVNVAATAFGIAERGFGAATATTSIKALAGTPIGTRYGTPVEVASLADAVGAAMATFLAGTQEVTRVTPVVNFETEFARPILDVMNPESSIPRKAASLIAKRPPPRPGADPLALIMAAPDFPNPMYEQLRDISQQLIMPGAETVPQNTIAILESNRRFIESYLAGLNHAFAGELRWREYPTDQRGTCFRQFWDTSQFAITKDEQERYRDIGRMHEWTGTLGQNRPKPAVAVPPPPPLPPELQGNPAMVLIRGDLFRRYPDTIVYAVPAQGVGDHPSWPQLPDETHEPIKPILSATLPPDMFFFGFDLTAAQLKKGGTNGQGYFIVLEECIGDTRFGADEATGVQAGPVAKWNDLSWAYLRTNAAGYIDSSTPPTAQTNGGVAWGPSASVAWILQQRPMRVIIHAKQLLP